MKVLYLNPVFLDYRIPFYKRLSELFGDNFSVLYSPNRYKSHGFFTTLEKVQDVLRDIAIPHNHDYVFYTANLSFKFHPRSRQIPIPLGLLYHLVKLRPDVVITEGFFKWSPWAVLYTWLLRKDLYIYFEGTLHTERNLLKILKWQRKFTDKFVKGYFANGTETKKYLLSLGVYESKIFIGGMCADSNFGDLIKNMPLNEKNDLRNKFHKNGGGLVYLYVGRVEHAKGVDLLMDAWKSHYQSYPNDTLLLAGDGELLDICQKQEEYGIVSLGRIPYDRIYKYFAISDVFVIATLQDNWSLVVPEAMLCRLPVAVSIYNGCYTDLVEEGKNGYCFDPLKKEDIVNTLSKFHNADLEAMGLISEEKEKPYNIENSTNRIFNAININNNK